MAADLYTVLGVPKDADPKQIKAAYRRLARKYHPDVNPNDKSAEARFKEVSAAYEVLGDPEKRKLYDRYGHNWEAVSQMGGQPGHGFGGSPFGHEGFGSLFEQIFGGMQGGFGGAAAEPRARVQPADVEQTVEVTLEEIDKGSQRTLSYQVQDACKSCDAAGHVRTRSQRPCPECGGTGRVRGMFGMAQGCQACQGTGVANLEPCPTCRGAGSIATTKKVEIKIPAGISDGKKLRVPGRGVTGQSGRAGDLYVVVREAPHPRFKRKGEDLETEVTIPYTTAALGGAVEVPTLRGTVEMRVPECTQSGQTFRLAGKGIAKMGGGHGHLLVRVKIGVPRSLTDRERKLLRELQQLAEVRA
jgi:chaperone protein DnaJ